MPEQLGRLKKEIDWGELLLEIQTEPGSELTDNHFLLYEYLYGRLEVGARKWLSRRRLSESQDGILAAIGIEKIFRDIGKFAIPDDCSDGVRKAFTAWALICSEREWIKEKALMLQRKLSSLGDTELEETASPSPEELLILRENANDAPCRAVTERALMKQILDEELNKLQPEMKKALLETEDEKRPDKPTARGESGVAAQIARRHGYNPGAVRTARTRLLNKVEERFQQEVKS